MVQMKIYMTTEYFGHDIVRIIKLSKYGQSYYVGATTQTKYVDVRNGKDRLLTHESKYYNFGDNYKFNSRYKKWVNNVM